MDFLDAFSQMGKYLKQKLISSSRTKEELPEIKKNNNKFKCPLKTAHQEFENYFKDAELLYMHSRESFKKHPELRQKLDTFFKDIKERLLDATQSEKNIFKNAGELKKYLKEGSSSYSEKIKRDANGLSDTAQEWFGIFHELSEHFVEKIKKIIPEEKKLEKNGNKPLLDLKNSLEQLTSSLVDLHTAWLNVDIKKEISPTEEFAYLLPKKGEQRSVGKPENKSADQTANRSSDSRMPTPTTIVTSPDEEANPKIDRAATRAAMIAQYENLFTPIEQKSATPRRVKR